MISFRARAFNFDTQNLRRRIPLWRHILQKFYNTKSKRARELKSNVSCKNLHSKQITCFLRWRHHSTNLNCLMASSVMTSWLMIFF